ncbi:hypothetical protein ACNOYE_37340 [Nannocystaceae bacterium ST9]
MLRLRVASLGIVVLLLACTDDGAPQGDEVGDTTSAGTSGESSEGDASESSSSESETSSTTTSEADTTSDTATTADATTGDGDGDGDGGVDPYPVCTTSCSVAADCAQPLPAYDEDNWECTLGGCFWLGCHEGECSDGDQCREGVGVPTCLPGCSVAADCDLGIGPYVASNYECDAGACVFTGCSSDAECQELGSEYVCADDLALPVCLGACQTPDDCGVNGQPAFDADNYACESNHCIYQGCMAGECAEGQTCTANPG